MDLQLKHKIALVTGSTAGIGHGIATALAREGASVIVSGRTQAAVDVAVAAMRAETHGEVTGFAGDLSVAADAERLYAQHPHVDILVNNMGIFEVRAFADLSDDDWRRFFDANVLSGVRLARLYLPQMLKRNWGRIIFISSESGYQIPAEMIHYGVTKSAQIAAALLPAAPSFWPAAFCNAPSRIACVKGFDRWPSIPASRHMATCSANACAVTARM